MLNSLAAGSMRFWHGMVYKARTTKAEVALVTTSSPDQWNRRDSGFINHTINMGIPSNIPPDSEYMICRDESTDSF
ncbi:hypothetical protein [Xanthomonas euroxanthea]|uniref:hypothetical protein n=1 Tax=Xanthomonas euroxanthea TaxID=2259622 RepID=UPI001E5F94D1|nr:hypothetical protein [Xanthomonas euroxanthea]